MQVSNPYLPCNHQDIDNISVEEAMGLEGIVPSVPEPKKKKAPKTFKGTPWVWESKDLKVKY